MRFLLQRREDPAREVRRRFPLSVRGIPLEALADAIELRVAAAQLIRAERVAGHRSAPFGPSTGRRRSSPRRRWVLTVFSGRPVASATSASDSSPKNLSATTSRYGSANDATAPRTSRAC